MRVIIHQQLPLMQGFVAHEHGLELATMSTVLDQIPEVLEALERDLLRGRNAEVGRPGLSAEQVLRALVLKQLNGFSYDELAFHLADSRSYRAFCRLGECEGTPSRSTLQANMKSLTAETLEGVNRALVRGEDARGIERGEKLRVDCTAIEATLHWPSDSRLLWDVTRVLGRLMTGRSASSRGLWIVGGARSGAGGRSSTRRSARNEWRGIGSCSRRRRR
jgi:IS5 family transposase